MSSALISGYTTFARLRSLGLPCCFWAKDEEGRMKVGGGEEKNSQRVCVCVTSERGGCAT